MAEHPELNIAPEQSLKGQAWQVRTADEESVKSIMRAGDIPYLLARLLSVKGISAANASEFLAPKLRSLMPDPMGMADMGQLASLIVDAVKTKKKVTIFADYDVDGATSAAQLVHWARHFGSEFDIYVPDRLKEGYGPSVEAFRQLKAQGTELIITVDCGATAHDALREADTLDLPIGVIDHHMMDGPPPPCAAMVNPNRQDDISGLGYLAAAGVTFMVLAALNMEAKAQGLGQGPDLLSLLGFAALGTVCDVVPMKGLNRGLVSQGLKVLSRQHNVGLRALADIASAQPPFSTYHLGFVLGPRINAGGRIGRASMGAELLTTKDAQRAYANSSELDRVNAERRKMQADILAETVDRLSPDLSKTEPIIQAMEGWHPGVIGIVAGRLKDRFYRPSIVIGLENGIGKGSGRSIEGVNLGEAIIAAREAGLLMAGGGHAMAAGLTIEEAKIQPFQSFLAEYLSESIQESVSQKSLKIDALLPMSAINRETIALIEAMEPFGPGHPAPIFSISDVRLSRIKELRGGHARLTLRGDNGRAFSAVWFGVEEWGLFQSLRDLQDQKVTIAARLKRNERYGYQGVDVQIVDLAKT